MHENTASAKVDFVISKRAKNISIGLIVAGLIALIVGMTTNHTEGNQRFWSDLLFNGFFFFGISLGALFFYALQHATETAWTVLLRRVFEAIFSFIPYGAIILIIVFAAGTFHIHHLYHWMNPEIGNPQSEEYDAILAGKSAYLNQPFFWIRTLVFMGTFIFSAYWFRKQSVLEDSIGGTEIHFKKYRRGALFLVFFAVFSSVLAWDWIMSIDAHWFSTMFGWYTFSGMWVSGMITTTLLTVYLRSRGYLPTLTDSHIHDLGKWVFAISFLWSYLWFSQFMLIWYSNIPEEVTYFMTRFEHYKILFFTTFFVNFALPMVVLIARDAKRNVKFLITIGSIIFVGHWLDAFLMVVPGIMHEHGQIGFMEIGMFLMFLGTFIFIVLNQLTKTNIVPTKSPFLDESIHHSI
jgi:hypothetical protein